MKAVIGLIFISTNVAPPIRWISRCPAVMFAVSRTASAIGWINKLIVSIIINIGISGKGVPWGRKWASEALVLYRKPVMTAPAHSGIAIPKFIESWVVGVNECGNNPRRLVEPIKRISEININVHVCPFWLWIVIICFEINWISHCWRVTRRLLISRLGFGSIMLGNIIIITTIGNPIIVGVAKEANKFSFILILKGYYVLMSLEILILGLWGINILTLLAEK